MKRIAAARTKGEWQWDTPFVEGGNLAHLNGPYNEAQLKSNGKGIIEAWDYEGYSSGIHIRKEDAEFIVMCVNNFDKLLAVAEAARRALKTQLYEYTKEDIGYSPAIKELQTALQELEQA